MKIDIIENLKQPNRISSPNILISMNLDRINNDYDSIENEGEDEPNDE